MNKLMKHLVIGGSLVALAGCDNSAGDDDSSAGEEANCPLITETMPAANATDFFFRSNIVIDFNQAPGSVDITLADNAGAAITGAASDSSSGRTHTFNPDTDLSPSAAYTATINFTDADGNSCDAASLDFTTGPYGNPVSNEDGILGATYDLDLSSATFVEPPGVGPILASQLGDVHILFMGDPAASDLGAGLLHVLGSLGEEDGGNIVQDTCNESLNFTYGADGVAGTADDAPADWNNPEFQVGPTDLTISFQGIEATINGLFIGGTFHPELDDIRGMVFEGTIDTRPLAPVLDPNGGEGAICDLVEETIGTGCVPCLDGEDFCLYLLAEDITANSVPTTLVTRSCADIITDSLAGTSCLDKAADYDEDGDGIYELCPSYTAP